MFVFVTFIVIYIESISVDMLYRYSNVVHLFSFFFLIPEQNMHLMWIGFVTKVFVFKDKIQLFTMNT